MLEKRIFVQLKPLYSRVVEAVGHIALIETSFQMDIVEEGEIIEGDVVAAEVISQAMLPALPRETDRFLFVSEASEWTGISKRKLRRLCRQGILECIKRGRVWLISEASLEEYLSLERSLGYS